MDNKIYVIAMTDFAEQFDRKVAVFKSLASSPRPARGWLNAVRQALGMTTKQAAARMNVSQPRFVEIEKAEVENTITLKTLQKAARALGCRVVYVVIPEKPLAERLMQRALLAADRQLSAIEHTMTLENQTVADKRLREKSRRQLAEELLQQPARLWDE